MAGSKGGVDSSFTTNMHQSELLPARTFLAMNPTYHQFAKGDSELINSWVRYRLDPLIEKGPGMVGNKRIIYLWRSKKLHAMLFCQLMFKLMLGPGVRVPRKIPSECIRTRIMGSAFKVSQNATLSAFASE